MTWLQHWGTWLSSLSVCADTYFCYTKEIMHILWFQTVLEIEDANYANHIALAQSIRRHGQDELLKF